MKARKQSRALAARVFETYRGAGRTLSFWEFLDQVRDQPYRLLRSSPQYIHDMIDHFGSEERSVLGRTVLRHTLFEGLAQDPERQQVVGQETVTDAIYRILRGFAADGRATKLILLHGPNGSAKTTIVDLLVKGLERYSMLPEGVLYRFSWIFPRGDLAGGGLGFAGRARGSEMPDSYAHLEPDQVASIVDSDMRTNPIYLIPRPLREEYLGELCGKKLDFPILHVLRGDMGMKSRAIYEALLGTHKGDWLSVMRYVRVERFTISRRYRAGVVTIEPQGTMDAETRQVTADMNLANLPPALQNLRLYEVGGDLIDGNRGLIEFSDFLKRPLELNKYLLTTTEKGTVRLPGSLAYLDCVMLASANEKHLDAFKTDPNFTSFKARMELVTVPYLLEYEKEVEIYRDEVAAIRRRLQIAPHTARGLALWAVLTRLWRPDPAHYEEPLKSAIPRLTPLAKALLYSGRDPAELEDLTAAEIKLFRDNLDRIAGEWRDGVVYEGRFGASAREMKTLLVEASYRTRTACLTPVTVWAELRKLVKDKSLYDFLKLEPKGLYNNPERFVDDVERATARLVLREIRECMALVDEKEYDARFEEYFRHATAAVRGTRIRDPVTGQERPADESVLAGIEDLLDTGDDIGLFRQKLIGKIAAFSLGRPGTKPTYRTLFPDILRAIKREFFARRGPAVDQIKDDLLLVDTPAWERLPPERKALAETTLANLESRYGYPRECALEVIGLVLRKERASHPAPGAEEQA